MRSKTINPFIMAGSYAGLLAAFLLSLKGWYVFWWLLPLFGVRFDNVIALNAAGGFIVGYLVQILIGIFNLHSAKANKK